MLLARVQAPRAQRQVAPASGASLVTTYGLVCPIAFGTEFGYLAEQVTGIDAATLVKASRVELADSALHAPQAGFGDTDFYPDIVLKAAVLASRIARDHPLPDGNTRAAWACLLLFVDLNKGEWAGDQPNADEAVDAMFAVAARGRRGLARNLAP